ncbi:hypothetical protein KW801_01030 [Candidatus Saccharibacteria bacterium]|nr:hypothetical protein [Candidatus Saccharibacteria bacterium]
MHTCKGEDCSDRRNNPECNETLHHLHSSKPLYADAGIEATAFRELEVLTVWIPRCAHTEHHHRHEIDVEVPCPDVMKECVIEEKKLRKLLMVRRELTGNEKILQDPEIGRRQTAGLLRRKEQLIGKHTDLLTEVGSIEIIPEELITGALLIAAPNHARSRIMMGSGVVLPGLIRKTELSTAHELVNIFTANPEEALQTGVNAVQLAA